jgi:hypothetical protein
MKADGSFLVLFLIRPIYPQLLQLMMSQQGPVLLMHSLALQMLNLWAIAAEVYDPPL